MNKALNNTISLAVIFILFLSGCNKSDNLTNFKLSYNQEVVIPSGLPVALPFNVLTPEITTNSESEFSNNNTKKDLVRSIIVRSLALEVISPSGGNFNFLNAVSVYISADGLPEVKIAWKENIPADNSKTIELETSGTDLQQYIIKDKFKLRVETTTDEVTATDYRIDVKTVFDVKAKIL